MSSYKLLDWRGKLPGQSWSNIGSQDKTPGRKVVHYSGDDADIYRRFRAGEVSLFDLIAWETRYQMTPGLYSAGFTVNGMMYHEVIWEDVVAIVRNPDAKLWHCKDGIRPDSWNYSARSIHIPLTTGVRASERTIRTLTERCDDLDRESGIGLAGRKLTKGHQEISSTACPGNLMGQFVLPYRGGSLVSTPPVPLPAYRRMCVFHANTAWSKPRAAFFEALAKSGAEISVETDAKRIAAYSDVVLYSEPVGKRMFLALGKKTGEMLSSGAREVLGEYDASVSDCRRGITDKEVIRELRVMEERGIVRKGSAAAYAKQFSPKTEAPAQPTPVPSKPATSKSREAGIIDRYFGTGYGQEIVEEADRAGLALNAACALVEQESNGRNIFGADWGARGVDAVPFAHLPVTAARVAQLVRHVRAGGTSNGVGLTQLTWRDFIYEAEALGGAHLTRNQLRVGFKLLAGYFERYGEQDGYGSYNTGEGNRASVRGTYSASCIAKSRAWRARLA